MRNRTRGLTILAIAFIAFSLILFVIPGNKTVSFWTAYAFSVISFATQIITWNVAFKNGEPLKSKFMGIPIAYIGTVYLIVQSIATLVFRFVPVEAWVAIVVSVLVLAISLVLMISSQVARDKVNRVESKVKPKINFIRTAQCDIELLASSEADTEVKLKLTELAEKIRFSDPMSNEQLKPIEAQISGKINELKNSNSKTVLIGEIDALLTERNFKSKLLK